MLREENIQISLLCDMDGLFITTALTCTFSKCLSDLKQNGTQKRHQSFPNLSCLIMRAPKNILYVVEILQKAFRGLGLHFNGF